VYNAASQVASICILGHEAVAVKFVPAQPPEFRKELAKCWREVKAAHSPITACSRHPASMWCGSSESFRHGGHASLASRPKTGKDFAASDFFVLACFKDCIL